MTNLKKTNYKMMVRQSYCYGAPVYRRVWVDENGDYFVKDNGELCNVTHARKGFMVD